MRIDFIPAKRFRPAHRSAWLKSAGVLLLAVAAVVLTAGIGLPLIGVAVVLWLAVKFEGHAKC